MKTDLRLSAFEDYLNSILKDYEYLISGEVANYIPELAKVDPELFGIAIVTVDGHVYQAGDTLHKFTIQSISKPFVYGIALEENGIDQVIKKVDVEPSGEAFNSISLEDGTGRPRNAMINAGAIATTGLIPGIKSDLKVNYILNKFSIYAGHQLSIDKSVYKSESITGNRNRAISYLLRNSNIIERNPEPVLDAYFQQCSVLVNSRDLALMGATLANNGVNPITGVRALQEKFVSKVLSVMTSCGMYDYSGAWLFDVGMPAKSGVAGGVLAVLPGQLGIAVYSPRLDSRGNSVRGLAVCKKISNDFGLHMLRTTALSENLVIRNSYDATKVRSKHIRRLEEIKELDLNGNKIKIFELCGELRFTTSEIITSNLLDNMQGIKYVILDFTRVSSIDKAATNILLQLFNSIILQNVNVMLSNIDSKFNFVKEIKNKYDDVQKSKLKRFHDIDQALEYCENMLLNHIANTQSKKTVNIEQNNLCIDLNPEELDHLKSFLNKENFKRGKTIIKKGDEADSIYFILAGQVIVTISDSNHIQKRLAILSAGSCFGELAIIERRKQRSANIIADTDITCAVLRFHDLENDNSLISKNVTLKLLSNISRILFERLSRSNEIVNLLS